MDRPTTKKKRYKKKLKRTVLNKFDLSIALVGGVFFWGDYHGN